MKRREFITLLGGAATWPLAAHAQPAMPVIGILCGASPVPYERYMAAIRQGLKESGYVEGRNVMIEYRWAENQYGRLSSLAADLVKRQVAVIITSGGSPPALAAKAATSTIPIVFHLGGDPVKLGLVPSLNRPGGNLTGVSFLTVASATKRLGILHELVPTATVIGILLNSDNPDHTIIDDLQAAAGTLGLQLHIVYASTQPGIDAAFATFTEPRAGAVFVNADPFFVVQHKQIVGLAARHAIPAMYAIHDFTGAGGLMSYGAGITDAYRQEGIYAGKILNGANPGDLPVMQSTKLEFVINLKTAKALAITIPDKLLALADEVIE